MARSKSDDAEEIKEHAKLSKSTLNTGLKIFSYTKPYRTYYIVGMFFLILSTFTVMGLPYFLTGLTELALNKPFFVLGKNAQDALFIINDKFTVVKILMVILLLQAIASFLRVFTFSQATERTLADLRGAIYNKIITLPSPFFENNRIGELTSRLSSDVSNLQEVLSITIAEFFRQIFTFIIGFGLVLFISWKLMLWVLFTIPPLVIIAFFFGKKIKKIAKETQQILAKSGIIVEETFTAIAMVKAYTNENFESKRYKVAIKEVMKRAMKSAIFRGSFISFIIVGLFGILVFLAWKATGYVQTGDLNISDLLQFVFYSIFIGGSIAGLGENYGRIMLGLGATERISEILEYESETQIRAVNPTKFEGKIEFKDISFSYPSRPELPVLNEINFTVQPGQKIALVGSSGAGKSTIIQLLFRNYPLNKGNILIDDKDFTAYDIQDLRANTAIVPQEVILFGGTIRDNICYGKLDATDEEILIAAKKANATEFIERFPEGLNTLVGERGLKLSGGQKQRIAIARAILRDPAILLLDEATSSLDAESEKLVQSALNALMEGRTTIIVAHRLSTIRNVDEIIVIDHGKIAEKGTHQELSNKENGIYNNLLRLQFSVN